MFTWTARQAILKQVWKDRWLTCFSNFSNTLSTWTHLMSIWNVGAQKLLHHLVTNYRKSQIMPDFSREKRRKFCSKIKIYRMIWLKYSGNWEYIVSEVKSSKTRNDWHFTWLARKGWKFCQHVSFHASHTNWCPHHVSRMNPLQCVVSQPHAQTFPHF